MDGIRRLLEYKDTGSQSANLLQGEVPTIIAEHVRATLVLDFAF